MADVHLPRFEALAATYALDALEGEDLREFEEHLAEGCDECQLLLVETMKTMQRLAESAEPLDPSQATRARILQAASAGRRRVRRTDDRGVRGLVAAGVVLLAVWGGWAHFELRRELAGLSEERTTVARRLAEVSDELTRAQAEREQLLRTLSIIAAPRARSVVLAGLPAAPDSSGHTYVNLATRQAVFYAYDLPPLARDRTYQLWLIAEGQPVSAGIFEVDAQGRGSVEIDNLEAGLEIEAWAVTVEPAGGVSAPTGDMVLLG